MNKEIENLFYSSSDALNLLKWFISKPKKILDEVTYKLSPQDFSMPYSVIFSAIKNIAFRGANFITEENLLDEIRKYPQGYIKFQSSLGEDVVHTLFESTEIDPSIAEAAYERVKKFTTLRILKQNGFPVDGYFVSDFLNEDNIYKKIDNTDIHSIIAPLKLKLDEIENSNAANEETCKDASDGLDEMVKRLRQEPDIGVPTDGKILNYIVRGCRLGKLYLYSAPSGSGKTRTMISNACNIALPYWDGKQICNVEHRQKVLFIATEMDHEEIQRLVLAYVSGVSSETINDGSYSPADEEKLNKAVEIIKEYKDNFLIEYLPNPNISAVKSMIERHIEQDKVGYIFYDYIFSSPGLVTEFASSKIREDVGLMMLSNTLKEIATTHKVFVMSATQLSGDWEGTKFRNMGYIRGSKAVADKVDIGMIGIRLSGEEKTRVEKILGANEMKPNIVIDVYKNRSGRATEIKLFRYFDYATCRSYDCFVTDAEYNRIDEFKQKVLEAR